MATTFGSLSFYTVKDICDCIDSNYPDSINSRLVKILERAEQDMRLNISNRGGGGAGAWIEGTVIARFYDSLADAYKIRPFTIDIRIEWDDTEGVITGRAINRKYFDTEIQGYADDMNEVSIWLDEFFDTVAYETAYGVANQNPTMDCDI